VILRRIGAVVLGVILAVGIVQVVEVIGHKMYPPPPGYNMHDMNNVKKYVASLPVTVLVVVLAGWLVGTLVGTFAAAKIGRSFVPGYIVGVFLVAGGIANALVIPQPLWFSIASFVIYIAMTLIGAHFGVRRLAAAFPK